MKPEVDADTQEIFEQMAEDLAKSRKDDVPLRRQRNSYGAGAAAKIAVLAALGAAILVLLVIVIFRGSGKQDMTPFQSRLDLFENRLALLEGKVGKIEALEERVTSLQQAQVRLESSGKTTAQRLDKLDKQMEKAKAAPPTPRAAVQAKPQIHEVRPGDTLFGIAGEYGITLDHLLRLNNLKKDATIQPGQKLLIAPERP